MAKAEFAGQHCQKYGLTFEKLDSLLKDGSTAKLTITDPINNGLILELYRYKVRQKHSWKVIYCWLKALCHDSWPKLEPSIQAITKAVKSLHQKHHNLVIRKDHAGKAHLEAQSFSIPGQKMVDEGVQPTTSSNLQMEAECLEVLSSEMAEEISVLTCQLEESRKELAKLEHQLKTYKPAYRNARRREKRKEYKIKQQSEELKKKDTEIQQILKDLDEKHMLANKMEVSVSQKLKALGRYKSKLLYWKQRCQTLNDVESDDSQEELITDSGLRDRIVELEELNIELNEQVTKLINKEKHVTTFTHGRYIAPVLEVCLDMLSRGVGIRHVSPIIQAVLEKLAKCSVDRLPSCSLLAEMTVLGKVVSYQQVAEDLCQQASGLTLHSDGTTKFGDKYMGFQVSTEGSSYSLALADIKAGTADNTLEMFLQILEDIQAACKPKCEEDDGSSSAVTSKILLAIQNTMSDRHVVQKKFNELLEDYRKEMLPKIMATWNNLSKEQQVELHRMNNFFCGLHFLVAMADTASECLKEWERLHCESGSGPQQVYSTDANEPDTVRLVRIVCKAVHKYGSEKAGCYSSFMQHLRSQGITTLPLAAFRGNRFNIIFYDGAGLYYVHSHLVYFFRHVYGTPNRLLQAVSSELQRPELLAGIRALGLIGKLVTGPLWRIIESGVSITALNIKYQHMAHMFREWASDSSTVITGEAVLFHEVSITQDEILKELVKPCENDGMVTEILQIVFTSFASLMDRLLAQQLQSTEGKPIEIIAKQTKSVPNTNAISERDFAQLDRLLREKPHSRTVALEGIILFVNNKTREWLHKKSEEEKEKIFCVARKAAASHRKLFLQRRKELEEYRSAQLRKKEEALIAKQKNEEKERNQLISQVMALGFWRKKSIARAKIQSMSTAAQKRDAIKLQLKYRRTILQQVADKSLFLFSSGGHQHSIAKLQENLFKLIGMSSEIEEGTILPYRSPNSSAKTICPHDLVGCAISHRFREEDGSHSWYRGTILRQIGDWSSWKFEVAYEGEDSSWEYDLSQDWTDGDIQILD